MAGRRITWTRCAGGQLTGSPTGNGTTSTFVWFRATKSQIDGFKPEPTDNTVRKQQRENNGNSLITADIHPSGPAPSRGGRGGRPPRIHHSDSFIKQQVTFHSAALRWDSWTTVAATASHNHSSRTREVLWGHQTDQQLNWEHSHSHRADVD